MKETDLPECYSDSENMNRIIKARKIKNKRRRLVLKDDTTIIKSRKIRKRKLNLSTAIMKNARRKLLKSRVTSNKENTGSNASNNDKMSIEMCEILSTISKKSSHCSVCTSASKAKNSRDGSIGTEIKRIWKQARYEKKELVRQFSEMQI